MPDRISHDLADRLARAIHHGYVEACAARGESPHVNLSMRPWEDLPDDLQHSNYAQASHIGVKLDAINCTIVPVSGLNSGFAFTDNEIEELAELEHRRWVGERTEQGILCGPIRDDNHHPDLVGWECLSSRAKDKDRDVIRELPAILRQAGFQILRLPPTARSLSLD